MSEERIAVLGSEVEELHATIRQRGRAIECLERHPKHHANPDMSQPANSMEWKGGKVQKGLHLVEGEGAAGGRCIRQEARREKGPPRDVAPAQLGKDRKARVRAQEGGPEARAGCYMRMRGTHGGHLRARARHHGDQDNRGGDGACHGGLTVRVRTHERGPERPAEEGRSGGRFVGPARGSAPSR